MLPCYRLTRFMLPIFGISGGSITKYLLPVISSSTQHSPNHGSNNGRSTHLPSLRLTSVQEDTQGNAHRLYVQIRRVSVTVNEHVHRSLSTEAATRRWYHIMHDAAACHSGHSAHSSLPSLGRCNSRSDILQREISLDCSHGFARGSPSLPQQGCIIRVQG